MKKIALKISLVTLGLTCLVLVWPNNGPVRAQGLNNNSSSGTQLFCKRDFSNFLTNGLDFDGEGFLDYWNDIIVIYNANYCQYLDIDGLLNQIDKARKQIRQAFYVCDNATSSRVAAQYYQLSAELYYLRHFVTTSPTPNPNSSDAQKQQVVTERNTVRAEFMDMFVKKLAYFDQPTADQVFEKIKQKYASKIENYRNCTDPNWEQLIERIKNLGNTFDNLQQVFNRFQQKLSKRWSAMEQRVADNPGMATMFSSSSFGDFMNRVVDLRVNTEPAQQSTIWEQLSFTAKENAPFSYGNTQAAPPAINYQTITNDLTTIQQRDTDFSDDLQYVTEYDLKYRQTQGLGLDTLKVNLDNLKTIISDTLPYMDQIEGCTGYIVDKQCGGG